ncbi:restriction endonuclease [Streptomyces lacrimifluminis]|uniref:restriction endonuclease n=1 Tax=Streptomyces lacrimifluminis TaxID=1500077 RepID=UPI00166B1E7E|nr:restriction endonuclease [Streptomyces lacrimifluminis]
MARNYADLSPYDFELLVRDLLQAELGLRLETFPPGRDGGVDVRLHRDGSEQLIVQCKHTPGKRFSEIKGQLEREAKKVSGRFTATYMLVTTGSLTRANKIEITKIFKGVNLKEPEIWGVDDIENLLRRHPSVEQKNFKLWITSTATLQMLLHSAIYQRSSGLIDHALNQAHKYVHTEAFPISLEMLEGHHVCVISGEPGIGKTTLAEMLILHHIAEGWQAYVASEDVSDIDKVWRPNEKQIFFYDDFLGQNSLTDKLNKNEDGRLAQIIQRMKRDPSKRFVLTTREYILRQAAQVYEPLRRISAVNDDRFILKLDHYTPGQRALILYNHIYFSKLSLVARQSVIEGQLYRKLVNHRNYSPRLIELITATYEDSSSPGQTFAEYAHSGLEDPEHLWNIIFEYQLSESERNLLLVLATFPTDVLQDDLQEALAGYESVRCVRNTTSREVLSALKRLQGTFVTTMQRKIVADDELGESLATLVRFSNPSFNDYICRSLVLNPRELTPIIEGCQFFEQLETIWQWHLGLFAKSYHAHKIEEQINLTSERVIPILSPRGLAAALHRTMSRNSCQIPGTQIVNLTVRRKRFYAASRDASILKMHSDSNFSLLTNQEIEQIIERLERRVQADPETFPIDTYATRSILSLLMRSGARVAQLVRLRDQAYEVITSDMSTPDEYDEAWRLLTLEGFPLFAELEEKKNALRDEFLAFVKDWDRVKSEEAASGSECENAIEEVASAGHTLGIPYEIRTPLLDEVREQFDDEHDRHFEEYYQGSSSQNSSLRDVLNEASDKRSVDEIFETLRWGESSTDG